MGRVGDLDEALAVEYKNVLEPDSISAILDRRNSREELFQQHVYRVRLLTMQPMACIWEFRPAACCNHGAVPRGLFDSREEIGGVEEAALVPPEEVKKRHPSVRRKRWAGQRQGSCSIQ